MAQVLQMASKTSTLRDRYLDATAQLNESFVARDEAIRCIALATLLGGNCLLIGDPGTGKTSLIERWLTHISDAKLFSVLCGSFTTLDEVVGPADIAAFQAGRYERSTAGMLPEATHGFLDEVMKSNDGCINSLLSLLNERTFGGRLTALDVVLAATNWPEIKERTEKVEALYDRFVFRCHVECCKGTDHTRMLVAATTKVEGYAPRSRFTLAEIKAARAEVKQVVLSDAILVKLTEFVARLASDDVVVSDRRSVKAVAALRASAWLAGRSQVTISDFAVLRFVTWADEAEIDIVDAVLDTIDGEVVRTTIATIDEASRAAKEQRALSHEFRVAKAPATLKRLADAAAKVKATIAAEETTITDRGLSKIRAALKDLGQDYAGLKADIKCWSGLA